VLYNYTIRKEIQGIFQLFSGNLAVKLYIIEKLLPLFRYVREKKEPKKDSKKEEDKQLEDNSFVFYGTRCLMMLHTMMF